MPAFLRPTSTPAVSTSTTARITTTPKNFLLKRRERLRVRHRARGRRPNASPRPRTASPTSRQEDAPSLALRLEPVQPSSRQQTVLKLQVVVKGQTRYWLYLLQDISVFSKSKDDAMANLLAIVSDEKVMIHKRPGLDVDISGGGQPVPVLHSSLHGRAAEGLRAEPHDGAPTHDCPHPRGSPQHDHPHLLHPGTQALPLPAARGPNS
jgi:hypothetical protein